MKYMAICLALVFPLISQAAPKLSQSMEAVPSGAGAITTFSNCGKQLTRPAQITIACAGGNNYLTSLTWERWSATEALGTGIQKINDCDPDCASGKFHDFPVTVKLEDIEGGQFRRMELTYPLKAKAYRGAATRFPIERSSPFFIPFEELTLIALHMLVILICCFGIGIQHPWKWYTENSMRGQRILAEEEDSGAARA